MMNQFNEIKKVKRCPFLFITDILNYNSHNYNLNYRNFFYKWSSLVERHFEFFEASSRNNYPDNFESTSITDNCWGEMNSKLGEELMTFHFSNKIYIFLKHITNPRKYIIGKLSTGSTVKFSDVI